MNINEYFYSKMFSNKIIYSFIFTFIEIDIIQREGYLGKSLKGCCAAIKVTFKINYTIIVQTKTKKELMIF